MTEKNKDEELSELSVLELKKRVYSDLCGFEKVAFQRFSKKSTVQRSDGRVQFRTTINLNRGATVEDRLPYFDPSIICSFHYNSMMFLLNRSHPSSMNTQKGTDKAAVRKRVNKGPTMAGRMYEMVFHFPKPVAQIPRCVSMDMMGMNPTLKGCVDMRFQFFLNDFDDESGPVTTVTVTASPVRPSKKRSYMASERSIEKRTVGELIKEANEFQRCDPQLCGVQSSDLVFIGVIKQDAKGVCECEWCMNLWNGLYAHPYLVGSGDHVGYNMSIEMVMQFITQLFRRMDKLLSAEIQARLRVHAWRNSPLYLRYQKNEFLKMVTLGKGALRMTSLSVRSPLECELSLRLIQDGLLKYTAHVRVSPVFDFSPQL